MTIDGPDDTVVVSVGAPPTRTALALERARKRWGNAALVGSAGIMYTRPYDKKKRQQWQEWRERVDRGDLDRRAGSKRSKRRSKPRGEKQ